MASFLGPQRFEIIVDREKFEKELAEALHKALNAAETAPKEKHVRTALIATWREKGCTSFWKVLHQFPLTRSHVVCWKACFVIHRALRDGHPEVSKKSSGQLHPLGDIAKHWGRAVAGYSLLIAAYIKVLMTRIAFQIKNPQIVSSLNFEDTPFQIPTDIDYVFQLAVEVFDLQSSILHLYAGISSSIETIQPNQLECHLAPLIPSIQDSAALYDLTFKLMKTLHSALPADTLTGHRDRFNRQYQALRKYFHEFGKIKYLQSLVKIPSLSPDAPSFLVPGQLTEESLARQVQMFALVEDNDQGDPQTSVTSSMVTYATVKTESKAESKTESKTESKAEPPADPFDAAFGGSNFGSFSFNAPTRDEKDTLIEQLMREVIDLKERISDLEGQHRADEELMASLRERVQQLEMELADYKDIAEQTCSENVLLKKQLETKAQSAAQEASNAQTKMVEEKFAKLREVYQKLRTDHIQLLRENGETQKKFKTLDAQMEQREASTKALEAQVNTLSLQMEEANMQLKDDTHELELVKEQLKRREEESSELKQAHSSLKEQLRIKEEESLRLEQAQAVVREQLKKTEEESTRLGQAQSTLREQLKAKEDAVMASRCVLVRAVSEAEAEVQGALEEANALKPTITTTSEYLLKQTAKTLDTLASTTSAFLAYSTNPASLPEAVACVSSLGHAVGSVVIQGAAISSSATAEDSQKLSQSSQQVGSNALAYLALLKQDKPDAKALEVCSSQLKTSVQALSQLVENVVPVSVEDEPEEALGDMVEEELAATSHAVEAAARRIQEMLERSREDDSGVTLEVNEAILDSCTGLMKVIKVLIERSKDLQSEILAEGVGGNMSAKEFYKKNSRWSEGLISASKQVGWGASVLVDAADKVVQGTGKFEELVVSSRDIAASTAQLVAASRVKARPKSEKLKSLKACSRAVSEATGQVVASTQAGAERKNQVAQKMDYSKLSLTQAKRLEMESQVKALELEKELEMERTRLAELRKVHYHLAGTSEGWEEES